MNYKQLLLITFFVTVWHMQIIKTENQFPEQISSAEQTTVTNNQKSCLELSKDLIKTLLKQSVITCVQVLPLDLSIKIICGADTYPDHTRDILLKVIGASPFTIMCNPYTTPKLYSQCLAILKTMSKDPEKWLTLKKIIAGFTTVNGLILSTFAGAWLAELLTTTCLVKTGLAYKLGNFMRIYGM